MQITLMRHGKPVLDRTGWISPREMAGWITRYDTSEVEQHGVPAPCVDAARTAMVVIVSTASRAASSAHALGRDDFLVDALFCEAQLPFPNWRFPYLPAQAWALLFRIGWLFGYARGTESVHECRQRARQAALRLAALAAQQPILLMGHGVMNELIAKELLTMGWQGPPKTTGRYWDFSQYQKCGDGPVYTSDM